MKKLLVVLALISSVGTANAVSAIRYNHRMQPMPYYNAYNAGYNAGYHAGKKDHQESVYKAVGVSLLVVAGGILVYQLAKPSDNYAGQVQIARF